MASTGSQTMTNSALLAFCPNAHSARIAVGRSTPASLLHGVATARMSTVNAAMDLSTHSRSWLASPTASICSRVKVIFSALRTRRTFFVLAMLFLLRQRFEHRAQFDRGDDHVLLARIGLHA